MPNPKVTVLMAVYNGENYLKLTIESILNQTFKDFEFVIVNDGSTDSTSDIIKSYKDPRIVLHDNKTNIGQTKSLNVGLNLSKGKYIARTDAGDVSLPMRLEKQVKYIEKSPVITVLGTSAFRYNELGKIIDVVRMPSSKAAILQRIFFTTPVVHVSVLMKREVILSFGGYDENYYILADYELWSRLIKNGYIFANMRNVLVGYRVSPHSFGAKNIFGKSNIEAVKIIKNNINDLTPFSVSREQAEGIRTYFTHNMAKMSLDEIISVEELFLNIMKCLNIHKPDAKYPLVRNQIKYVLGNLMQPTNKIILYHALKSILLNSFCVLNYSIILKSISNLFKKDKLCTVKKKFPNIQTLQ